MIKVVKKDNKNISRHAVLLLGDSGAGKTRLAATAPSPLFIDSDLGAEGIGVNRVIPETWEDLLAIVNELKASKRLPGYGLMFRDMEVKTLVLDTVDSMQELCRRSHEDMIGKPKMKQQFYGKLLDEMLHYLVWPVRDLPCDVVFICHSAEKQLDAVEAEQVEKKGASILPETTLALEGSLRKRMLALFDNIFHLINLQDGSKKVLTTSAQYEGRYLIAKDRRWVFGGKPISLGFDKDGNVVSEAFTRIFAEMHKNDARDALISQLKKEAADYAVEKKVMVSKTDAVGGKVLAGIVATLKLDDLTEANYATVLADFKSKIDEKAPKEKPAEVTAPTK